MYSMLKTEKKDGLPGGDQIMKLTNKHKREVRRKVEMEGDKTLNHSSVFVNKKKYNRKFKHKKIWK